MTSITAAAPQFLVDDLGESLVFYEQRLGFARDFVYEDFYASVSRDRAVIHLKCAPKLQAERTHRRSEEHLDAYLVVCGVRELHDELASRGARIVKPLERRPWGACDFYVEDPDGYVLCFAETVSSPKEVPMPARPFVVAPKDYAPTLDIVGEHVTVLASGEATQGYEIFLQRGPEGSGPPPHTHPWDESFFVVTGEVDFGIGDDSTTATAGTLVHLPAGTQHWFRFGKGGGDMISMTSRLGASKMFADLARELAPVNPDLAKFTEVGARHGLKLAV
jgi:quercetin dioxygenase-like cupin family protein/uncharacterized glyoxalase superfamily protein PhnB